MNKSTKILIKEQHEKAIVGARLVKYGSDAKKGTINELLTYKIIIL